MSDRLFDPKDYEDAPIIRIAHTIIKQGIVEGASEILLKPTESSLQVLMRAGEQWRDMMPLPLYVVKPLAARFRVMADLDYTCKDRSQEGRIPVRYEDRNYTIQVRTQPDLQGERIILRF